MSKPNHECLSVGTPVSRVVMPFSVASLAIPKVTPIAIVPVRKGM
jgi:hypothetical protein